MRNPLHGVESLLAVIAGGGGGGAVNPLHGVESLSFSNSTEDAFSTTESITWS